MKKLWLLVVLALCFALPCMAEEEATVYSDGYYEYVLLDDDTAEIVRCSSGYRELIVPSTLGGHVVSSLDDSSFDSLVYTSIVTIRDNVINMNGNPFALTEKLVSIKVSPEHTTFASIDGILFNKIEKKLICFPRAYSSKSYVIPQGILSIGDKAFFNCERLTTVTIPDSVTVIKNRAFFNCNRLTSINIPDNVISIGDQAFAFCRQLTSIFIPDSVTYIGSDAFSGCDKLTTITVSRDSYAAQYCKDNDLPYTYPDANDWLLN